MQCKANKRFQKILKRYEQTMDLARGKGRDECKGERTSKFIIRMYLNT